MTYQQCCLAVLSGALLSTQLLGCSSKSAKTDSPAAASISESQNEPQIKVTPTKAKSSADSATANGNPLVEAIRGGNVDAIRRVATNVLAVNSADPVALNALGASYLKQERPLAAQYFFNKAIAVADHTSAYHNNLGLALLAQQKDREAVREFKRALDLDPKNADAAGNLGTYYLSRRDFRRAFVYLDQGFPFSNKDSKWMVNYAVVSAWKGNLDVADKLYQQALQQAPSQRDILYNAAILKIEYQHKSREGLDLLDRIKVMGVPESLRAGLNVLENHAKAGLK
jgi:Flp pilus assembly protein TadD